MTQAITVTPQSVTPEFTFAGVQFTRSKTGHIHSIWWSYDWKRYNPSGPYQIGSHFHGLRAQSIAAFASTLGIPENEVMVSVRDNPVDGQLEWRCGSVHPVPLPKRTLSRLETHPTNEELKAVHDASRRGAALNAPKGDVIDV